MSALVADLIAVFTATMKINPEIIDSISKGLSEKSNFPYFKDPAVSGAIKLHKCFSVIQINIFSSPLIYGYLSKLILFSYRALLATQASHN